MTLRHRCGQALAFVLLALVALALVAAVGTRLVATQQRDRADSDSRAALALGFANRVREAAASAGDPAWTPVRRLAGDESTALVDLNGDALQVAQGLHLLVRDLGLGADAAGFEATGAPPPTAEDPTFDAGWVLAHRRGLAGDRFTSPTDLASVSRGGTPIWGDAAGARELAILTPFLEASPAPRAAITPEGALIDLNGDPLELSRLLYRLLEVATGPDGLPLGRNGQGIEIGSAPPVVGDLAPASDGKLADVIAIVRARLARVDARFADPAELALVPQFVREGGTIRAAAAIWGPAERWELERLVRFLSARDEPSGARRIDLRHAARELLVAAFAVHLADLVASGTFSASELADDWIDRRRTPPDPTTTADFRAFLAAHGLTASAADLSRFSLAPDARHHARFTLVALSPAPATSAYYREGDPGSPVPRVASGPRAFAARLDPLRLATTPVAPIPPELLAGDPFALELRGGRPLYSSGDRLPASATTAVAAIAIPAGTRAFAWRIWLDGDAGDSDIQALALYAGAAWRARATGEVERSIDLGGTLGASWVPLVAGRDPSEPVVSLAAVTSSALYALDAAGALSTWDTALERWIALAGPALATDDRPSAVCCARVAGADRLYLGTRAGRVFHATGSGAWIELPAIDPSDPPRILALAAIDPTTHVLAAGVLDRGIWELGAGASTWLRGDTAGVASAGSFALLASGELLAGTSAGIWSRAVAGGWTADPDLSAPVASLATDGVTPYAGTLGGGIFARALTTWSEVGGASAAGRNIRAMALDAAGVLVWGAAADGGIAIECSFSAGGVEVGAIEPARLPLAGGGARRYSVTGTLTAAADTVALRAVRYRRLGSAASSIPVLAELALEDGGALVPRALHEVGLPPALDPPPHARGMRQER